jgi:hypothetical protein
MLHEIIAKCQKDFYNDNLLILICNIFFTNLKNSNTLIKDNNSNFTLEDLKNNYDIFKICVE